MSKSKTALHGAGAVALVSLVAGGALPRTAQAHTAHAGISVYIGVSIPLNEYPNLPEGIEYGVKIAAAEANALNTVPGVNFQVKVLDDTINNAHDPVKDAANARSFIADSTVIAEVGPLNSGAAQGSIPVYNNAQMVQISPANTLPDLTNPKFRAKYEPRTASGHGPITYFRTVATDQFQGPEAATYAFKVLKVKRAYITDNTGAYGVGLAKAVQAKLKSLGVTIAGYSELDKTQPKLGTDALAANIASSGSVDLVYFGGEFGATGGAEYLADALKAHGVKAAFMGGDGIFDQHFISGSSNGGVLGAYATSTGPYAKGYPAAQHFLSLEKKAYPKFSVSVYDLESYDAAWAIIKAYAAAAKAKTITLGQPMNAAARGAIAKQVAKVSFNGSSGPISFDANGDIVNKVFSVYRVTGTGKSATWSYVGVAPQATP